MRETPLDFEKARPFSSLIKKTSPIALPPYSRPHCKCFFYAESDADSLYDPIYEVGMTYKNYEEMNLEEKGNQALVRYTANQENDSLVNDDTTLTREKDFYFEEESPAVRQPTALYVFLQY